MNQILACTDGSTYAPSVYHHSAWAATRSGASVHVLHMLDAHRERADLMNLSGNLGLDTSDELLSELVAVEAVRNRLARERGKQMLTEARRHLIDAGVAEAQITTEQQHGSLVESVTRMERDAGLVVIGKRGESADFAKLHLGSNLERVIRASIRPVLVASRKFEPIKRFLIAYDGGPSSEKAIQFVQQQPLLKGLTCHLLRAGKIDSKAQRELESAAETLRQAGFSVEAKTFEEDPEKAISETVEQGKINLLVMGAYGHSRIRQLMVGSTTTTMVRTCKIPVLMFR